MTKLSKPADAVSNARGTGALMTMTGLARLVPYKRNARIHSRKQIRQIASSIERFGFTNPILIDDNDMILAGHGRAAAAPPGRRAAATIATAPSLLTRQSPCT